MADAPDYALIHTYMEGQYSKMSVARRGSEEIQVSVSPNTLAEKGYDFGVKNNFTDSDSRMAVAGFLEKKFGHAAARAAARHLPAHPASGASSR